MVHAARCVGLRFDGASSVPPRAAQCGARSAVERERIQHLYLSSCRDTDTRSPKPWAD